MPDSRPEHTTKVTKRNPKPDVHYPRGLFAPRGWHASQHSLPYRPGDHPVQEDWESVAQRFDVDVRELIHFNYFTLKSDEVNWYLYNHGGFRKVSPSGNNYMFHSVASPGIIYIPPPDIITIDFTAEEMCVWMPEGIKQFMNSLRAIAQGMSGQQGKRIKKLVQVILRVGYPRCLDLWYYNDMAVLMYVRFHTDNAARREMTSATNGIYPFDGDSGTHGNWRIYPMKSLFEEFACGFSGVTALKRRLEWIDEEMYKGWYQLTLPDAQSSQGGGSAFGPLVPQFINHVRLQAKNRTHLYWAFGS